jgi:hypothetical protein
LTAHELLFGVNHDEPVPRHYAVTSPGSSDVSPQLSPVFKSEAARAIVMEMSSMRDSAGHNMEHQPRRRAVPKEKRRHHTVSSSEPLLGIETTASPIMVLYKACHFLLMAQFPSLPLSLKLLKTLLLYAVLSNFLAIWLLIWELLSCFELCWCALEWVVLKISILAMEMANIYPGEYIYQQYTPEFFI